VNKASSFELATQKERVDRLSKKRVDSLMPSNALNAEDLVKTIPPDINELSNSFGTFKKTILNQSSQLSTLVQHKSF